jgi:hypothetical protein
MDYTIKPFKYCVEFKGGFVILKHVMGYQIADSGFNPKSNQSLRRGFPES